MTTQEALIKVYEVLNELYQNHQYVPSGSIELVKPKTPGLIDLEVQINPEKGFLKIETKKKIPNLPGLEELALSSELEKQLEEQGHQMLMNLANQTDAMMIAKSAGFTGNICVHCGQAMMVRQGTCEKCMNCGETSGCS